MMLHEDGTYHVLVSKIKMFQVKMSQSGCWTAYVIGTKAIIIHFVNLKGTYVLYY